MANLPSYERRKDNEIPVGYYGANADTIESAVHHAEKAVAAGAALHPDFYDALKDAGQGGVVVTVVAPSAAPGLNQPQSAAPSGPAGLNQPPSAARRIVRWDEIKDNPNQPYDTRPDRVFK